MEEGGAARAVDTSLELSILMPCLNEAETLAVCIKKARSFIEREGLRAEILVADNGSTDGSPEIARSLGARVVDVPVRGYGAALHYGSLAAWGTYVIMGDSDDSYDFQNLKPFLDKLREGADLVMGNRFHGGIAPGAMPWKNRYIGNPILSGIGRLFFRCPAGDFHCGLRGYSVAAYRELDLRTTGMEFASEMVIKATLRGQKIDEVPTTLKPDGRSRPPHLRPWRDGWRHLRFMLMFSPRWLFLYPGASLLIVGLVATIILALTPVAVAGVVFDVNTLLYSSSMILVGFQLCLFAIFTKLFAAAEGLMPKDDRVSRLFGNNFLEVGLITGAIFLLGGIVGFFVALSLWINQGFGNLDTRVALRVVIPSVLGIALGIQTIFSSFFISILQLKLRHDDEGTDRARLSRGAFQNE